MPLWILMVLVRLVHEIVRAIREKTRTPRPEPLCAGCLHAHAQYGANGKRAISCTYSGTLRAMKLDVLYCTDYQTRDLLVRDRAIGFVYEIAPVVPAASAVAEAVSVEVST